MDTIGGNYVTVGPPLVGLMDKYGILPGIGAGAIQLVCIIPSGHGFF